MRGESKERPVFFRFSELDPVKPSTILRFSIGSMNLPRTCDEHVAR